jgi:hypothetical protein
MRKAQTNCGNISASTNMGATYLRYLIFSWMASSHADGYGRASFRLEMGIHCIKNEPILSMLHTQRLIIAAIYCNPARVRKAQRDIAYYQKNNAKAYRPHRKSKLASVA